MLHHAKTLAARYAGRGVLVDTNLYLLWLAGALKIEAIGRTKRLKTYDLQAFHVLSSYLSNFQTFFTTPSVVTEISNLTGAGASELIPGLNALLRRHILTCEEFHVPTRTIVDDPAFFRLGIADAASKIAATHGILLVTDDFALAQYAAKQRLDVVNFNHIRLERPDDLEL